jgi:hypothetical protein
MPYIFKINASYAHIFKIKPQDHYGFFYSQGLNNMYKVQQFVLLSNTAQNYFFTKAQNKKARSK